MIEPSRRLAAEGFKITAMQASELNGNKTLFKRLNPLGTALVKDAKWTEGDRLTQSELSNTLKLIKEQGRKGFYEGAVADSIVAEMQRGGGITVSYTHLDVYKRQYYSCRYSTCKAKCIFHCATLIRKSI